MQNIPRWLGCVLTKRWQLIMKCLELNRRFRRLPVLSPHLWDPHTVITTILSVYLWSSRGGVWVEFWLQNQFPRLCIRFVKSLYSVTRAVRVYLEDLIQIFWLSSYPWLLISVVLWDLDSGDSTGSTEAQSQDIYSAAVAKNPNNILALNHETSSTTAWVDCGIRCDLMLLNWRWTYSAILCLPTWSEQLVPYAIKLLQSKGYQLVTVAECLGLEPYQSITNPGTRDVGSNLFSFLPLDTYVLS
jgi:hypothetical protein